MSRIRRARPHSIEHPRCPVNGKTRWSTQKGALGSASVASRHSGKDMRVYKCTFCRGWHLTSKTDRKEMRG
jgi:hypothetical protein